MSTPDASDLMIDTLIADSPLPPLDGPESIAEQLILLVHRGVNWTVWGGPRAPRYWDALTDRVRAATYAGPTLSEWWQRAASEMVSEPRNPEERLRLATLLATDPARPVLDALHKHAATLVLRTRVHIETSRTRGDEK